MASASKREYQLLLELKAKLDGKFNSTFTGAANVTKKLQTSLSDLTKAQSNISGYQKSQAAIKNLKDKKEELIRSDDKNADAIVKVNQKLAKEEKTLVDLNEKLKTSGIDTKNLVSENDRLQKSYDKIKNSQEGYAAVSQAYSKNQEAVSKTQRDLLKTSGIAAAGIAALWKGGISPAVEFESAFAGVTKTVDATPQQLAKIKAEIRDLSRKDIPATTTEISAVAEAAGQLGIENKNIMKFSKAMIDLGESTNLASEDAASSLARFANITKMSQNNFDKLGSVIVDLGNNFATTENDIVNMAMNLAGAGKQVGLSEAEIMAFSAALSSVGIEADKGGSAFSKTMVSMQLAVEKGGDELKDFAKVSGVSTSEFKKTFKNNAADALNTFITGLSKMDEKGISAIKTLDDMGFKEVRLRDTLLRATNANELFNDAQARAKSAWEENNALTKEASQRYATAESKIKIAKNAIADAGISLGEIFIPYVAEGAKHLGEMTSRVSDFIKKNPQAIKTFTKLAGGALAAKIGFTGLKLGFLKTQGSILSVMKAGKGLSAGLKALQGGKGLVGAAKAATGLTSSFSIMSGVMGGIVVGSVVLGTALYVLNEKMKKADLKKRFGDISLSVEEMDDIANRMINTKTLEKTAKAFDAFGNLKEISENIKTARTEIEKTHWKLSIGLKLTEEEKEDYKSSIDSYVNSLQTYVKDQGYALSLGLDALFDEKGIDYNKMLTSISGVTKAMQGKLAELGKDLSKEFSKGIIDFDPGSTAAEILKKMAEVERIVTESEYEAKFEMLKLEYGTSLDADSYAEFQSKLNTLAAEGAEKTKEVIEKQLSGLNAQVKQAQFLYDEAKGEEEKKKYKKLLDEAKESYKIFLEEQQNGAFLEQTSEPLVKAAEFGLETIKKAYPEIEGILGSMDEVYEKAAGAVTEWQKSGSTNINELNDMISNAILEDKKAYGKIDDTAKATLKKVLGYIGENINGIDEQIAAYKKAGREIPEEILKIHQAYYGLKGLDSFKTGGTYSKGFDSFAESVRTTNPTKYDFIGPVQIPYNAKENTVTKPIVTIFSDDFPVDHNAAGGIITHPILTTFAENAPAVPEAAIPLDNSSRSRGLWLTAGKMMGMFSTPGNNETPAMNTAPTLSVPVSGGGGVTVKIENKPTINVDGNIPGDLERKLEQNSERLFNKVINYYRIKQENQKRMVFN